MCSKCEEAYYCRFDHQRADWGRHSKNCKSIDEKKVEHFENKRMRKAEIFDQMSKPEISKAVVIVSKLVESEKAFIQKVGGNDI